MQPTGLWGISPHFYGLYPCRGQVAYVLLTSAPVADRRIATPSLPLDLHVLSLSLAFILSQDQTLRCCISYFYFFSEIMFWIRLTPKLISRPGPADDSFSPLCCTCRSGTDGTNYVPSCSLVLLVKKLQHFNELASRVGVLPLKSECKVIAFFNTSKIFREKNFTLFYNSLKIWKKNFHLFFAVFRAIRQIGLFQRITWNNRNTWNTWNTNSESRN